MTTRIPSKTLARKPFSASLLAGVLAAATFSAGCTNMVPNMDSLSLTPSPTERQDDPIVSALEGQPVAFVQEKLGLPNQRDDLPTGAMIWVYNDDAKGLNANSCKVSLSIRDGIVQRVSIQTHSASLVSAALSSCNRIRKDLS